ncbi:uncharacterized protein HaLaN_29062, partial [Haematococcus lacustris]
VQQNGSGGYGNGHPDQQQHEAATHDGQRGQPGGPRHDAAFVEGKLFLGGLDLQSTKETVQAYCAQWWAQRSVGHIYGAAVRQAHLPYARLDCPWLRRGEISDIVVMEGRGFGFVTFSDPAAATSFLQQKEHSIGKCSTVLGWWHNPVDLYYHTPTATDNRRVEAKAAVPRQQSEPARGPVARGYGTPVVSNKVFVGGTGDLDDEQLRNHFQQYGEITDCAIVKHPDGGTRGFGFVTFAQAQSADTCAGKTHDIEGRTVEVKRAVPR